MASKPKTRREVLQDIAGGAGLLGVSGLLWGSQLPRAKEDKFILRPPAAIDEESFVQKCTKCGSCVTACPYDTLKLAAAGSGKVAGTPYFEPRKVPCYLCTDVPCVPACPSGALDVKALFKDRDAKLSVDNLDVNKTRMGVAVIDTSSCIAHWGIQCDACYRACPLMDEAIKLEYSENERTGKHAYLNPVVDNDVCTGCGLCEHACVTEKAAIKVVPNSIALGLAGSHYVKGWDKEDEKRMQEQDVDQADELSDKAMDYLNNWESLLDDE